jgi:hypothetical protein
VLSDCVTIIGNPPGDDDPALYSKDAVLVALEKAYNSLDIARMDALLDDDFTFFFSPQDIQDGGVSYTQWDRASEITATAKLFGVDAPTGTGSQARLAVRSGRAPASEEEDATWGRIKALFYDGVVSGSTFVIAELNFPEGDGSWIQVQPSDPSAHPGEVWYQKTASYWTMVQLEGLTLVPSELRRASFVVRYSEEKGYWQLVEWRDDV